MQQCKKNNNPDDAKNQTHDDAIRTLRRNAEILAGTNAPGMPENQKSLSEEETRQLLHELRVHQIELEMQNDELRIAQQKIEELRERYFDLYDLAPVGYVTINEKGIIIEANLTAADLLGVPRNSLTRRQLSNFILPEDQDIYYHLRKILFETGTPQKCELRIINTVYGPLWVRLDATIAHNSEGAPFYRASISNITENKRAENEIKNLLNEKETLLREVHHRIKNNMNTIMSLINLQSNTLTNQEAIKPLQDAGNRIRSMMILYDKLYCASSFEELSIREYLSPLIDEIISIFPNRKSVTIEKHIDDIILKAKILFPLGIIINELLTNVMKHAFTGRESGMILVSFKIADKKAVVTVIDNGIGVPEYIDFENTERFGLNLINMMTKQIHGKIRIERQNGTAFILEFEI